MGQDIIIILKAILLIGMGIAFVVFIGIFLYQGGRMLFLIMWDILSSLFSRHGRKKEPKIDIEAVQSTLKKLSDEQCKAVIADFVKSGILIVKPVSIAVKSEKILAKLHPEVQEFFSLYPCLTFAEDEDLFCLNAAEITSVVKELEICDDEGKEKRFRPFACVGGSLDDALCVMKDGSSPDISSIYLDEFEFDLEEPEMSGFFRNALFHILTSNPETAAKLDVFLNPARA